MQASEKPAQIRTFTMASRVAQHGFREAAVGLGQKLDEAEGISEIGPHQSSYSSPETPPNRPTAMTMAEMPIKTQR
jgi:hypothetical protein